MRTELLGLELTHAQQILSREGIEPEIVITAAPKKVEREGILRVVSASDSGKRLIVSRFVDPVADAQQ